MITPSQDKELKKEIYAIVAAAQRSMSFPKFVVAEIIEALDKRGYQKGEDDVKTNTG